MKLTLLIALILTTAAGAEDIKLADGRTLQGTVARFNPASVQIVGADGKVIAIPWTQLSAQWRATRLATTSEGKELAELLGKLATVTESDRINSHQRDVNAQLVVESHDHPPGQQTRDEEIAALRKVIADQKEIFASAEALMKSKDERIARHRKELIELLAELPITPERKAQKEALEQVAKIEGTGK